LKVSKLKYSDRQVRREQNKKNALLRRNLAAEYNAQTISQETIGQPFAINRRNPPMPIEFDWSGKRFCFRNGRQPVTMPHFVNR